jgi:toxin YoeB
MNLLFTDEAWDDYLYWQASDKQMLRKVNQLIKEIQRNPFIGTARRLG